MASKPSKKAAAVAALLAAACLALVGGMLVQFALDKPEKKPPRPNEFRVIVEGTTEWDTRDLLLAIDDTVSRTSEVRNEGTMAVKYLYLSAETSSTPGLDSSVKLTDAVTVEVFYEGKSLAPSLPLRAAKGFGVTLPGKGLAPGDKLDLTFAYRFNPGPVDPAVEEALGPRYDFEANPDNRFQGASLAVRYTAVSTGRATG